MTQRIHCILEEAVNSGLFLGLSFVALDQYGKTLYSGAHGYRTFDRKEKMTLQTGGWVASMTKLMTSVAAMHAVENGLIGLDDDLANIIPEICKKEVLVSFDDVNGTAHFEKSNKAITLRLLLTHSSGFAYPLPGTMLARWAQANDKTMAKFYGDFEKDWGYPMVAHPAEEWNYGTGIDWTGKVVEKISNKTLEAYMRNNIWIPLNMKNTTFHPETLEPFLLLQMGTREGPKSPMVPGQPIYLTPAKSEVGGAGIFSTAEDYALLLAALLKEDGQFLTNETIEELVKPQLTERSRLSLKALRSDIGFPLPEIPDDIPVNHALSGLYASADIPSRRLKGAVSWEGMSSPKWLLDRSAGIALSLMVQVLPLDDDARMLWSQLEEEVYSLARSTVT